MNRTAPAAIGVALLVSTGSVRGAESFADTQYLSGRAGFTRKIEGILVIDDKEIRFTEKKGRLVFRVPMQDVIRAGQNTTWREYPMTPGTREYLEVEATFGETTETILFRTRRHQSAAMAAKIEFLREKAHPASPRG
ncbi:MAG: hypothetical protein DMF82_00630 [Acidobacteria bacterium]|nr:MAG: hypothetical protein DMF82_00630 [Acidobacteriota bacterium]